MEDYIFQKTKTTPEVLINKKDRTVRISGVCIPENPKAFFDPIIKHVTDLKQTNSKILFEIYLDYFNSSASRGLLELFNLASELELTTNKSKVLWMTDANDEAKEEGELMAELSSLEFEYVILDS